MAGMPESAKGIINWVLVVGIIAFILLLFGIIFGNLQGNVGFSTATTSVINESQTFTGTFTLDELGTGVNVALSGVAIVNTSGFTVPTTNYTTGAGTITALAGPFTDESVLVTYTSTYNSQGLVDTDSIILNYTESGKNTAGQLPTVGTILGIILLIIILLAALVFVIVKLMGLTDGKASMGSAEFGSNNGKF